MPAFKEIRERRKKNKNKNKRLTGSYLRWMRGVRKRKGWAAVFKGGFLEEVGFERS